MMEIGENTPKKIKEIKEITISNKKTLTSGIKEYSNEVNIIPIKITLTPKIKQNLIKNFNATSSNKLYHKNKKVDHETNNNIIKSRKIIMTPKIEPHFSNSSSMVTTPNVIIKNFNYNNVYNINIDKEKEKKTPTKIYKNYTYNKPKTTSNINLKNNNIINFNSIDDKNIISYNILKKEKGKKEIYVRINSDKNILANQKNEINDKIINNMEMKDLDIEKKNQVKTLYYIYQNNNKKSKNIKRTLSNMSINSSKNQFDNNYYLPFNPNELSIILEKINSIIISLSKNEARNIYINCQEFFDFYNNSSLKRIFPSFFKEGHKLIIVSSINLCLFSLIVIYNLSSENLMSYNIINIIERVLLYCRNNFSLFIKQIQIKYKINCESIFKKYLVNKNIIKITKEEELIDNIYQNSKEMTNDIKLIMDYYKRINIMFYNNIIDIFNNISIKKEDDFINLFFNYISRNDIKLFDKVCETSRIRYINTNVNNSFIKFFSPKKINIFENLSIKKDKINNNKLITRKLVKRTKKETLKNEIEIPYIKTPSMKKYTLILDLDKTLCYENDKTGEIILRNGLFSFLSTIKPFYELISFSLESKMFCDSIINFIEQDKKYFDYKFYKEHSILYENNFVKDISLIGRDISKIIIVDDDEICFKLNKENGIKIASFNGQNNNDNKLFELKKILKEICIENYEDVRIALKNYKLEIINKITLD